MKLRASAVPGRVSSRSLGVCGCGSRWALLSPPEVVFHLGKKSSGLVTGAFDERLQAGTQRQRRAVLLGCAPLLQESELFPWPAVAVPTSGGEGIAASEPRGIAQARGILWSCGSADREETRRCCQHPATHFRLSKTQVRCRVLCQTMA